MVSEKDHRCLLLTIAKPWGNHAASDVVDTMLWTMLKHMPCCTNIIDSLYINCCTNIINVVYVMIEKGDLCGISQSQLTNVPCVDR